MSDLDAKSSSSNACTGDVGGRSEFSGTGMMAGVGPSGEFGTGMQEPESLKERIADKVSTAYETTKETAASAYQSTRAGVSRAADSVREGAEVSVDAMKSAARTAGRQAKSAACGIEDQIRRHPLTCLAIAFGAGLIVGKVIDYERTGRI